MQLKPYFLLARVLLGIVLLPGASAVSAQTDSFNEKFVFTGVNLGEVTEDGTIYAASKQSGPEHNLKQYTNCTYFDENSNHLGYYAAHGFASQDPGEVEAFCISNFENRST